MRGFGGPDNWELHGPRTGYVDHGTEKTDGPATPATPAAPRPASPAPEPFAPPPPPPPPPSPPSPSPSPSDVDPQTLAPRRTRALTPQAGWPTRPPVTIDPGASPVRRALIRASDSAQSLAPGGKIAGAMPLPVIPAALLGMFTVTGVAGADGPATVLFLLLAGSAATATLWTRIWTKDAQIRHNDLPDSDRQLLADLDRTLRDRELSSRRCGELRQARDSGSEADTRWEVAGLLREAHAKEAPPADGGELPNNIRRVIEGARRQARRMVLDEQEATREVDGLRADIEEAPENVPAAVARLAERTERLAARLDSPAERSRTYAQSVRAAMKDLKERFPRPEPTSEPPDQTT